MRRWTKIAAATVFAAALASSGCRASGHIAADLGRAAIWTAATVGQIAVLTVHDTHTHHDHCGHYRRWHNGHWTYYYSGHWEYYDHSSGHWYYYAEATY